MTRKEPTDENPSSRDEDETMHPDQKIGLALGVLLVGGVAALFFRHETPELRTAPELRHGAQLDRSIAEKPHAPYIPKAKEWDARKSLADTFSPHDSRKTIPSPIPVASSERFAEQISDVNANSPIPIPDLDAEPDLLDRSGPPVIAVAKRTERKATDSTTAISSKSSLANDDRLHVVEKGETLSSISTKYFGRSTKYHEIFEANKDQLRDVHDTLKLGMKIRIPAEAKSFVVKEPVRSQNLDSATSSMSSATAKDAHKVTAKKSGSITTKPAPESSRVENDFQSKWEADAAKSSPGDGVRSSLPSGNSRTELTAEPAKATEWFAVPVPPTNDDFVPVPRESASDSLRIPSERKLESESPPGNETPAPRKVSPFGRATPTKGSPWRSSGAEMPDVIRKRLSQLPPEEPIR